MTYTVDKYALFVAFGQGAHFEPLKLSVINTVQREDGSNKSYNVTGITYTGETATYHVYTK